MRQISSTACRVAILAPNGTELFLGTAQAHERPPWVGGLLAAETEKDLRQAVGGFTLTLDAMADTEGRTWAQRIPMRSLVFLAMDRPGMTEVKDATVMIGLTDTHTFHESFSEDQPRRLVQIHGRELGGVIVDAHLLFHPLLAETPAYGTLTVTSEARGTFEAALIANPLLATPGEPKAILRELLNHFLFVGGQAAPPGRIAGAVGGVEPPPAPGGTEGTPILQAPLINLDLPGVRLEDLLVPQYDAWNTFEEPVTVPITHFPARVGSLWNYLHLFIDRTFQEFFTRIEDGVCKMHFRGKPFLHTAITHGTRFKSSTAEPTLQTLTLDPADILTRTFQRESSNVYNFFTVLPYGFSDSRTFANYRYVILPQVVTDPTHPSFVGRYGLRVLEVQSRYLSPFEPGAGSPAAGVQPLESPSAGEATYAPMANQLAAEQGLPAHLRPWFVANIKVESNFNPNAVSHAGAQGIAQFIPATAAALGLTNPFDPVASLRASAQYWNQLRATPGIGDNPYLIAAAYNAGPGAVVTHKGIPPFPETQTHVRRVEAAMPRYAGLAGTTPPAITPSPHPAAASKGDADTMIGTAQRWGTILKNWYDMGGELFGGTLTVRGDPRWNVGHRLVSRDSRGDWEAYIEGVRHQYDARTGQYLTTLRITRGWYLAAEIAAQLRAEGQTTVTAVSGGPPTGEAEPAADLEVTIQRVHIGGRWYIVTPNDELVPDPSPPKE